MFFINNEIKMLAKVNKVFLWQIAKELDVSHSHFSVLLREEFSEERKKEVLIAIEKLSDKGDKK